MAKTSQEIEQEFITGLKANTGKTLDEWLKVLNTCGIEKRNDMIKWLKDENNFGHMHASLLIGVFMNNGKAVYASDQVLLDNQFEKFPEMRPLYETLKENLIKWDKTVEFIVKKTYISLSKKREFAAINIKKGELRLGMDLGDVSFDGYVEKSKLSGPMARISHMVTIRSEADINDKIFKLLENANRRVNE